MSTKFLNIVDGSMKCISKTFIYGPGKIAANFSKLPLTSCVTKSGLLTLSFTYLNKTSSLFIVSGVCVIVDSYAMNTLEMNETSSKLKTTSSIFESETVMNC